MLLQLTTSVAVGIKEKGLHELVPHPVANPVIQVFHI
jgi:hypothetical protein